MFAFASVSEKIAMMASRRKRGMIMKNLIAKYCKIAVALSKHFSRLWKLVSWALWWKFFFPSLWTRAFAYPMLTAVLKIEFYCHHCVNYNFSADTLRKRENEIAANRVGGFSHSTTTTELRCSVSRHKNSSPQLSVKALLGICVKSFLHVAASEKFYALSVVLWKPFEWRSFEASFLSLS